MIGTLDFQKSLQTTVSRVALAFAVSLAAPVVLLPNAAQAQGVVCMDFATSSDAGAVADGTSSTACGELATASGDNSTSYGYGAGVNPVGGDYDIAGGGGATAATAEGTTAVGYGAVSNGDNGVAVGITATANGNNSIAIGGESRTGTAGDTTGNTGQNATAIGYQAVADANGGTAIGQGATANFLNSTALGLGATTSADNQMTFGTATSIYRMQGLSSAASTAAQTGGTIKMVTVDATGNLATADITAGSAITGFKATNGTGAAAVDPTVTGNNALAAGSGASTGAFADAIAIGQGATVTGNGGIAIGKGVTAGANEVVIGATGNTYKLGGLSATAATGYVLGIDQNGNLSVVADQTGAGGGSGAIAATGAGGGAFTTPTVSAGKANGLAVGSGASATADNAVAIGAGVTAGTANQMVLGNATNTYTLGGLKASAATGFVLGIDDNGNLSVVADQTGGAGGDTTGIKLTGAAGGAATAATATGNFMTAIGSGSSVTGENGVALGASSVAGVHNTGMETAGGASAVSFGGVALTNAQDANGVVSVSGGGINRQITGIADGALNGTSTDAVNGAQLFGVATALDTKAGKIGTGLVTSLGGGASVATDGTVTGPSYAIGGTSYNTVGDAIAALSTGAPAGTGFAANKAAGTDANAIAGGLGAVASGYGSSASAAGSTAIGQGAQATFANSTAIGTGSATTRADQQMFGTGTSTYTFAGINSAASKAAVTGTASLVGADANGNLATFTAAELGISGVVDGVALTNATGGAAALATATGNNVSAIGSGASATVNNNVALGALSTANTAFNNGMETAGGASAVTIAGVALTNAQDANGVVSVSGGGINRQITGIADGALNATSTDAVNGAQLYGVATALDTKSGNIGAGLIASLGGGATIAADGTVTGPSYSVGTTTAITNVGAAINALDDRIDNISAGGSTLVSGKDSSGGTTVVAASTTGNSATAVGSGSVANGNNTLALGAGSTAGAAGATAIGQGAQATFASSTAIGAGAETERTNQVVYGTSTSTHTMKGTTSAASKAQVAATGSDTYIMVTNANGDVAAYSASDLNLGGSSDLTGVRSDIAGLRTDVNKAFKKIDENTQGIAVAIAMTGALNLPVNHNFGISANWGNYEGKNAFSSTAALRLSENLVASGALGVGMDTGSVGTRLGMQLTW